MATETDELKLAKLREERRCLRISITKSQTKMAGGADDSLFVILEDKASRLFALDKGILKLIQEDEIEEELEQTEAYREKFLLLQASRPVQQMVPAPHVFNDNNHNQNQTVRLPKIQIRPFDGCLKKFLQFWGQFKKIHENPLLSKLDKFEYLLQLTEDKAHELLERFPISEESYDVAIEEFKERFGNAKRLKQLYVRELASIVLSRDKNTYLPHLYDSLQTQLRALEALNVTRDLLNTLLFPLVEMALPPEVLLVWERTFHNLEVAGAENVAEDDMEQLLKFLKREADRVLNSEQRELVMGTLAGGNPVSTAQALITTVVRESCIFCKKQNHSLLFCYKARKMPITDIINIAKSNNKCQRCLKRNHTESDCKTKLKCKCNGEHLSILCPQLRQDTKTISSPALYANCFKDKVFMQTLIILVKGASCKFKIRALFDSGSQNSYISSTLANKLAIKREGSLYLQQKVFGGGVVPSKEHNIYKVSIRGIHVGGPEFILTVLETETICNDVPLVDDNNVIDELKKANVFISDKGSGFAPVDMLIGANYMGKLLTGNLYTTDCGAVAIETLLGWTLIGGQTDVMSNQVVSSLCLRVTELWSLDVLGIQDPVSEKRLNDNDIIHNFLNSIEKEENRYVVRLPWRLGHPPLGENKKCAFQRLKGVVSKLTAQGTIADYDKIFVEWENEGIIEPVPENSFGIVHYLPHRPVYKNSITTKIRPVFDGSSKTETGVSINECLETGPNLLATIPAILTNFRYKPIGITADIRKAFLMIAIHPDDRDALRFIWLKNNIMTEYRFKRVPFGLTSSPFHLTATILHHLSWLASLNYVIKSELIQAVIKILKKVFYVDDLATSFDSEEEAENFKLTATNVMLEGGFELTTWVRTGEACPVDSPKPILGLFWNNYLDTLQVKALSPMKNVEIYTKRLLLSETQSIFDPIGFLCPVLVIVKVLLQETWKLQLGWDSPLPNEIAQRFVDWRNQLHLLYDCKIPRALCTQASGPIEQTLHVFVDASKNIYATCIFLRSEVQGKVEVQLVQAKNRVAPLEKTTIPRLELLGALIGSRLYSNLNRDMSWEHMKVTFWTDSMVVLWWLKQPNNWRNFVSNRVREILSLTRLEDWRFIPGGLNAADLPSRGCTAEKLLENKWWNGPDWLRQTPDKWVQTSVEHPPEADMELKKMTSVLLCPTVAEDEGMFQYFSSYRKTVRMVAWIKRFLSNCRHQVKNKIAYLSVEEVQEAEKTLFLYLQNNVLNGKDLGNLQVIRDPSSQLLTVQTRITNVDIEESTRHPIILPGHHILIKRMLREQHEDESHAGVLTLMTLIRKKFWITNARRAIKNIVQNCVRCKRFSAKSALPPAAPLPLTRTTPGKAFSAIGVDAFGPLYSKNGKSYGIIFTCCTYRAIHLELVSAMTTEAFILAFRRFIARRGRVNTVYSDNGLNFVQTSNLLKEIEGKDDWLNFCYVQRIRWIRNPPTASWYGGIFERLIRCVKDILKRVIGKAYLGAEELATVFCDTEAVINSRPLTYCNAGDPNELQALTPSMFIQDQAECRVPDLDLIDSTLLNKRTQYISSIRNQLRQRLKEEYLTLLVHRGLRKVRSLTVGEVVLIGSDDKKRLEWPLGRVQELYPGRDGQVRVVKVKTSKGVFIRPLQRLYSLELEHPDVDALPPTEGNVDDSTLDVTSPVSSVNPTPVVDSPPTLDIKSASPCVIPPPITRSGRSIKQPNRLDL